MANPSQGMSAVTEAMELAARLATQAPTLRQAGEAVLEIGSDYEADDPIAIGEGLIDQGEMYEAAAAAIRTLAAALEAALAAPQQAEAVDGCWRPIETAPKDGTTLLLFYVEEFDEVCIGLRPIDCPDDAAADDVGIAFYPDYWAPLPPAPEAARTTEGGAGHE